MYPDFTSEASIGFSSRGAVAENKMLPLLTMGEGHCIEILREKCSVAARLCCTVLPFLISLRPIYGVRPEVCDPGNLRPRGHLGA